MVRMHSRETDPTALRSHIGHVPLDVWRPRQSDRMLTIGAGGGLDVLFGQFAGVRDITAIDINPALPAMLEQFREFYGDLYNKPGTKLFIQEGRHFLARDTGAYDLIYLSLTQTATATGQGLALAESYIQTREGLQDAVARLTPSGALVLIFDQDAFLARAFVTALSILYSEGQSIAKAAAHLAVVSAPNKNNAPYNHLLIIKRSPLTAEETARLKFVTEARGFALSYLAPDTGSPLLKQLASSSEAYKLPEVNLRPVSDDSPFFSIIF
ncbi:hypothetical protein [Chenggangzhangella methanolivorans]|uniref:Methyltransferase domain-containing protein n=1 Tax=Chenggangzhangella methanolivorans TaxID=1437009 RepID=A0A9E6RGG2_9HYPH|nr:hypothetical protein [Chenggangzhangella methanolivorans]QZO00562.1 hypothetical protein K6K41_02195 [Chenggangzhangella methanolivorans]